MMRPPGLNLGISQGARRSIACPLVRGAALQQANQHAVAKSVPQAATMKGCEYFFMLSPSLLGGLRVTNPTKNTSFAAPAAGVEAHNRGAYKSSLSRMGAGLNLGRSWARSLL